MLEEEVWHVTYIAYMTYKPLATNPMHFQTDDQELGEIRLNLVAIRLTNVCAEKAY
jgi:hypothetical protein